MPASDTRITALRTSHRQVVFLYFGSLPETTSAFSAHESSPLPTPPDAIPHIEMGTGAAWPSFEVCTPPCAGACASRSCGALKFLRDFFSGQASAACVELGRPDEPASTRRTRNESTILRNPTGPRRLGYAAASLHALRGGGRPGGPVARSRALRGLLALRPAADDGRAPTAPSVGRQAPPARQARPEARKTSPFAPSAACRGPTPPLERHGPDAGSARTPCLSQLRLPAIPPPGVQ